MTRVLTKQQEQLRHELIRLAAEMVDGDGIPDQATWPWPSRVSDKLWQAIRKDLATMQEQCRQWGIALRDLADTLGEDDG